MEPFFDITKHASFIILYFLIAGVRVSRGENDVDVYAPLVISDAGLVNTFKTLLPPTIADKSCRYYIRECRLYRVR